MITIFRDFRQLKFKKRPHPQELFFGPRLIVNRVIECRYGVFEFGGLL